MSAPSKPVTVRDIAAAIGLHHTTVSLGLRNSSRLPPATLEKIQRTAQELGYTPNPMLSALNAYRKAKSPVHYQATIAWINNWEQEDGMMKVETFNQYFKGVLDRARQLGYLVEEFWLKKPGMTPERMVSILKARNIQGLLMPPQAFAGTLPPLDFTAFSAVAFGYTIQPPVLNVVTNHHYHSIHLLLTKLKELGYRRIGLNAFVDWDEKVENAWIGGLRLAWWRHPELVPIPPCLNCWVEDPRFKAWMTKYRPDVIVANSDTAKDLRKQGYALPEDIGFASLDLNPSEKGMSGLNENNFYIGQKAVDVLVGLLHRGERGIPEVPIRLLVESVWVPGETLRPQPLPPKPVRKARVKKVKPAAVLQ